jgi:hypothetical protein
MHLAAGSRGEVGIGLPAICIYDVANDWWACWLHRVSIGSGCPSGGILLVAFDPLITDLGIHPFYGSKNNEFIL